MPKAPSLYLDVSNLYAIGRKRVDVSASWLATHGPPNSYPWAAGAAALALGGISTCSYATAYVCSKKLSED
jgi:hypothetical protein